jgi:hypothetical protein
MATYELETEQDNLQVAQTVRLLAHPPSPVS